MLIHVISTSTAEPGALGTGLWFGHSHLCCHRAHSKLGCSIKPAPSPQQPCGSGWGDGELDGPEGDEKLWQAAGGALQ